MQGVFFSLSISIQPAKDIPRHHKETCFIRVYMWIS